MAHPDDDDPRQDKKSLDIQDVIAEERGRGSRGQVDVRTARERQRFRRDIGRLLDAEDERGFIAALQRAKIPEPHFSEALHVWRELKRRR